MMKNTYIGVKGNNGAVCICRVLSSDIATGDAVVYNRSTNRREIVKWSDHIYLDPNVRKLAQDTEGEFMNRKYNRLEVR